VCAKYPPVDIRLVVEHGVLIVAKVLDVVLALPQVHLARLEMLAILIDQVHGAVGATRNPQDLIRSDVDLDNRVRNARRDDGDRVLDEGERA
jgi:hypothetical protein